MILLSGHSLTASRKIALESLSLTLNERESSAMAVPTDLSGITITSWLRSDSGPANGTVWRVQNIQQIFGTNSYSVQLEHVINTLMDRILFGEITPKTITGNQSATTCTAQQAINYILSQQSDWVLGTFSYASVSNPYKFDGDTLYDALETVTRTLDGAWWSYDFSTYPFKLNITQKPSGVACELRAGRNLTDVTKTIDKTGMYTRFYPIGKDDLHISGNYVSKNENAYGVIAKVETDTSLDTTAELTAWANERLNKHAEPTVTIIADGLELADATGETLDRLKLGRICRIPLPEFGTTIEERIVELSYQDAIGQPEVVKVTMANRKEDLVHMVADNMKQVASGGRGGARQQKEDHAWFEDTDTRVAMVVGTNSGGAYIKAGEIALSINDAGQSEALINADKIVIGELDDEDLDSWAAEAKNGTGTFAKFLTVRSLTAQEITTMLANIGNATIDTIDVDTLLAVGADISGTLTADEVSASEIAVNGYDVNVVDAQVSGNTLTISYADGTTATFSKATSVTLSGEWSGTVAAGKSYKVTATSDGSTVATTYSPNLDGMAQNANTKTWAADYQSFTQEISVYDSQSEDLYKETLTFGTSQAYDAGVLAGEAEFSQVTARPVLSSGGTVYYQAGSSTLYYMAGTTTVVGRGDSVTAREVLNSGGTLYYTTSTGIQVRSYGSYALYYKVGESYVPAVGGTRTWYYADSGGTQYYNRANGTRLGSSTTYYKGNGGTKTVQGGETYITPITGAGIRLGNAGTYYSKTT